MVILTFKRKLQEPQGAKGYKQAEGSQTEKAKNKQNQATERPKNVSNSEQHKE